MGIYENIKAIADKRGISINKLEKDLGLPRSSVMKYNASVPSVEKIRVISEYLHVSIDDIIYPDKNHDPEHTDWYIDEETAKLAQEVFNNPDVRLLFDAARNSKPENIRLAAEMLRRFKETNPDG